MTFDKTLDLPADAYIINLCSTSFRSVLSGTERTITILLIAVKRFGYYAQRRDRSYYMQSFSLQQRGCQS